MRTTVSRSTALGSSSTSPSALWSSRFLIWNFARRDLRSRFKGTAVGWAWSLILPLVTVLIYTVVFSVFVRIPPPSMGSGNTGNYPVWLLVGMVTWSFMLNSITMSMPAILSNGSLLRKVYFPSYVPSVGAVVAIGLQSLIELGILLVVLLAFGNVGPTWLLVPVWVIALGVFTASIGYVLALLNVFYRDVAQLVTVALQLLFFLSAVIFPMTMVPQSWHGIPVRQILELNPMAQMIEIGRQLLYDLSVPSGWQSLYVLAWVIGTVLVAGMTYRRWGRDVGESI